MSYLKFQITILLLLVINFDSISQTIGTVTWQPQNPTSSDNIKLIVTTNFTSAPCSLVTHTVTSVNPILVNGYYCTGVLTTLCSTTDTFSLGQLAAGNHAVRFLLSGPMANCMSYQLEAIDNVTITVSGTTTVKDLQNNFSLHVYPNPNSGAFNLAYSIPQLSTENNRLVIYDIYGKRLKEIVLNVSGNMVINENWESGYYFYRIENESFKSNFEKLVIAR